ncbi:hypothetical protein OF83DRAFT_756803 [Amylostereum chailletii]|nr:hypothetical protein OF83DRAFT_756803 [Amylostereum chailletii]
MLLARRNGDGGGRAWAKENKYTVPYLLNAAGWNWTCSDRGRSALFFVYVNWPCGPPDEVEIKAAFERVRTSNHRAAGRRVFVPKAFRRKDDPPSYSMWTTICALSTCVELAASVLASGRLQAWVHRPHTPLATLDLAPRDDDIHTCLGPVRFLPFLSPFFSPTPFCHRPASTRRVVWTKAVYATRAFFKPRLRSDAVVGALDTPRAGRERALFSLAFSLVRTRMVVCEST